MPRGPADLAFVNGTVLTFDAQDRQARAVAVAGERIVAVGTDAEVRALCGRRTRVVDLAGGAVLPGINDSHLHAAMLGAYWPHNWLDGLATGAGLPTPRELRTVQDRRDALRTVWDLLLSLGVTSYTEPGLGPGARGQHGGGCDELTLQTYTELATAGELPLRVTALLLFGELDGTSDLDAVTDGLTQYLPPADGPTRWRVAGIKLFADGIPPVHTAWLDQPYLADGHGALLVRGTGDRERLEVLREMIRRAHRAGCQIGVHATGDRAIAETVRALDEAAGADGERDRRHYVIHGDLVGADTLRTMSSAGIGLNAQPRIFEATQAMSVQALGEQRATRSVPLRSALAAGVPMCLSSDGPVLTPDWRKDVAAAALRASTADVDERLGVYEALRAYTVEPARQDHAESWKGSVEVGKVADLCVLDRSPLEVEPEQIARIGVRMTVVGGAIGYERGGGSARSGDRA